MDFEMEKNNAQFWKKIIVAILIFLAVFLLMRELIFMHTANRITDAITAQKQADDREAEKMQQDMQKNMDQADQQMNQAMQKMEQAQKNMQQQMNQQQTQFKKSFEAIPAQMQAAHQAFGEQQLKQFNDNAQKMNEAFSKAVKTQQNAKPANP